MIGVLLPLGLSLGSALAQEPVPNPPKAPETQIVLTSDFDADLHNLLQVLGLKRKIIDNREQSLNDGRAALRRSFPHVTPEFDVEWERRWKAKFNVDEVVDIGIRVYAKYFTDAEVKQQISFQTARARHDNKPLSPELQKKIEQVMPALEREFATEAGNYGSTLSSDIGSAIAKEHPDWVTAPSLEAQP